MAAMPNAQSFISTETSLFNKGSVVVLDPGTVANVSVYPEAAQGTIRGFGGCFNEKGRQALSVLSEQDRQGVMRALFDPASGLGLSICRVPIGANDYALDRYSLNETAGDFEMTHFSIERDRQHLIPYIKEAMSIQPELKLWGSAWTPPTWMKDNRGFDSGNFIDDPKMYRAYALYLLKYLRAYRAEGLPMTAVAVQNEPGTLTNYPSCDWTATQYLTFIRDYLGPLFESESIENAIMLGTFNQPELVNHALTVLTDRDARRYVALLGMQWFSIGFMPRVREIAPGLEIWQTETDCGNHFWMPGFDKDKPQNNIAYAEYTFDRILAWLKAGASVYSLWNMVLDTSGKSIDSKMPWPQNSAITVDRETRTVRYTPMFGAFGAFAKFVPPGSQLVATEGMSDEVLAFQTPSGGTATVFRNGKSLQSVIKIRVRNAVYAVDMPPRSFGTLVLDA
jgi:glucosylceramidase